MHFVKKIQIWLSKNPIGIAFFSNMVETILKPLDNRLTNENCSIFCKLCARGSLRHKALPLDVKSGMSGFAVGF